MARAGGDQSERKRTGAFNIKDIAALAGVHESTVSRALNPHPTRKVAAATAARIRDLAQAHGYQPDVLAAGLRHGRSRSIGLLVPDLTDTHTAMIIRGVQDALDEFSVSVIVMETYDDRQRLDRAYQFMESRRVDALVVMSARTSDEPRLIEMAKRHPVILCIQGLPDSGLPSVTADDYLGGSLAAGYLAHLGHRVVAQLACDADIVALQARGKGFLDRARELGLTVVEPPMVSMTAGLEEGRRATSLLLASASDLPTAIFAHTDTMAIGAMSALRSSQIDCPGEMSVLGFDDSPLSKYCNPPLTTIAVPAYKVGQRAAAVALATIDGNPPSTSDANTFIPEVVVRESTSPRQETR